MRTLIFLLFLCTLQVLPAQNLVPNGSFEEYTECPDWFGQWPRLVEWESPYTMSADYFNRCASGTVCSVPFNHMGYQEPADGNGYAGLVTFILGSSVFDREILTVELIEPLQIGVPVYISYKVSTGGYGSNAGNSADWKAKGPDIKFFNSFPSVWEEYSYPNTAALSMLEVLGDTAEWVVVSGTYVSDSAYRYIAIANFYEDSLSSPTFFSEYGGLDAAYAFVDDVCVSYSQTYCSVSTKIEDLHTTEFQVLQNPFADQLTFIRNGNASENATVAVLNALGQRVLEAPWPSNSMLLDIPTAHLPEGVYWAVVQLGNGRSSSRKLLHLSY